MNTSARETPSWWARGLLFESCNCTLICPGHVHFSQNCTHERCKGYWAVRFDEGTYADVDLNGVRAVIAYDTPQHMIAGDWTEVLIVDDSASPTQVEAVESILTGRAGGPWELLERFVGTRLPTRSAPIEITDEGAVKTVAVEGFLKSTIEDIRGRHRDRPVTFQNMFNQIHSSEQVIASGETHLEGGAIVVDTAGSHALHSKFEWRVEED